MATLGNVCHFLNGGTPSKEVSSYFEGDIPWITSADIVGPIAGAARSFITEEAIKKSATNKVTTGAVLLVTRTGVGKVAIAGRDLCFSQDITALIPDSAKLDGGYLVQYLRTKQTHFERRARGATIKGITRDVVADLTIPLPPIPEQIRIAAILDKADSLRVKRREALAQLDNLTQSIFIEMFGDPATNPRGWGIEPFGDICENQDAQRIPVKSSDRDGWQGAFPYYGASGIIDWVDDYIYEGERLLIGEDGANLLARATPVAYIAQGKYWVNNHAHVVAYSGRANLRFLEFFIEQTDLKPYISGSAQPKLNRSNLDRIPVMLPPLEMQHEFANRIALVEKLKTSHRTSLTELDALFTSLQHRAFRGEL